MSDPRGYTEGEVFEPRRPIQELQPSALLVQSELGKVEVLIDAFPDFYRFLPDQCYPDWFRFLIDAREGNTMLQRLNLSDPGVRRGEDG